MKLLHLVLPLALIAAPALAMGTRPNPVMPGNQPVPGNELQALLNETNALYACVVGHGYEQNPGDFSKLDTAFGNANLAAKPLMNNYPRFVQERTVVESEISRLSPKYGC